MSSPLDTAATIETVDLDEVRAAGLDALRFDNRFSDDLPGDPSDLNRPRQVFGAAWSPVLPTPTAAPDMLITSPEVLADLGIGDDAARTDVFARVFSGNALLPGMAPHAACYGGHQFGNWAGQLGDGRAITLGEIVGADGNRHMLQLKGAGPTPYSRSGDGRAVLRSSVREFLCSEAMHHLGVPTTRALSLALTGDEVVRDMFYDGHPAAEPGAVVCRTAPSFIRFGSFEIFMARQDTDLLRQIVEHTITVHFPELVTADARDPEGDLSTEVIVEWYREVVRRTADLIVHWQRVGFVHGVMNTDNLSIHGLTIDYGPYGWLEGYDPEWTPNTTDAANRRYRYGNQPAIGQWNLAQLANAILPLVGEVEPLQDALGLYVERYNDAFAAMMGAKIGLATFDGHDGDDQELLGTLLGLLTATETDMTIFFRNLADVPVAARQRRRSRR